MPAAIGKARDNVDFADLIEERRQLQLDYVWIFQQRPSLQKDFVNKYVAVRNKEVIVSALDVQSLMRRLRKKGLRTDEVAVEFLSEHPVCCQL